MTGAPARVLRHSATRSVVGLAVSTVFIVLFLRNTDFGIVKDAFLDANPLLIVAAIGAYFGGLYFRAVRWHYLLRPVRRIPPHHLFPILAIGFGVNNVLPFRTGEVVRAHVLYRRYGVSRAAGLSSIFMARVFDGMMLTIFLAVGVAASAVTFEGMRYAGDVLTAAMAFLVFGVSAAFVLIYWIATHAATAERQVHRAMARLPGLRHRDATWVRSMIDGMRSAGDWRLFVAGTWTSAVAWGLEALMYFLIGEAFNLGLPFPVYLLVAAAANIIIMAPSTSGGVGPFEWAAKEVLLIYLTVAGAEEIAIAFAATLHGLVLIPIALLGLFFLWLYNVPLRRVTGREPAITADPHPDPAPEVLHDVPPTGA